MTRSPSNAKLIVVEAGRPGPGLLHEAWEYRELLLLLAWRDITVRYKQTVFGVGWAVLRPLLTTLIFVAVFSFIVKVPSPDVPYTLLVLAGLLPWQVIAGAVTSAAESLLGNAAILSKIYFPRMLFPVSAVAAPLVDFLVGFALLLALMLWYGVLPTWRLVALPALVALALCLAVGAGLCLSVAAVRFRDVRYVVPFIMQVGLYASPVGYPTALVPEKWQLVYALNPAVGVIDGFRWALLGEPFRNYPALLLSLGAALVLLTVGLVYFRRVERGLVDVL